MGLEGSFDADAVRNLAHGKRGVESALALADDDPFERLVTVTATFGDAHLYDHRIAWLKVRHIGLQLFVFDGFHDFVSTHLFPTPLTEMPGPVQEPGVTK